MKIEGFCGPSYRSLSKYAGIERSVNFFPEIVEDPGEQKARVVLYPTPCAGYLSGRAPAPFNQPNRGLLELNGQYFGVNGTVFFQFIIKDGLVGYQQRGTVADDGKPVQMIANGVTTVNQQIFISSAGKGYVFSFNGTFANLSANPQFLAGQGAAFLDDFFISIIPGTNGIQVSALNDGTMWSSSSAAYTQGQSDTLTALIADREYLWLFGNRRSEIWYNNGAQSFPFAIQPGAFLEIGIVNQYCLTQADNSLFWIGQDKRGSLSAWRANGLTPIRISNHSVETQWSKLNMSDVFCYSFLWRGHTFVRFIFPSSRIGWTYDSAASQQLGYAVWHENTFTDRNGQPQAPVERGHLYISPTDAGGQGIHVIGSGGIDGEPGALYQFTDKTMVDPDPVLLLRWSNDGGNTFGSEYELEVGKVGEYTKRCFKTKCGAARDRVVWVRCIDYGDCPPNPDGTGGFPVTRDRISPHNFNENKWIAYDRYEFEVNKGIGSEAGVPLIAGGG